MTGDGTTHDADDDLEIGTAASVEDLGDVLYAVEGPVATITMNRPEARNAQSDALLEQLDGAFARADRDDAIRVVVLAGEGKHFSAGHDLKELNDPSTEVSRLRRTTEGKLEHETRVYWDVCLRIRDHRKPTVAAVQGACVAAGLMLAACCDLIVASDDAFFANPVLRMSGAGVELLVEPYELGFRRAKAFLLLGERLPADEAQRIGLVHAVVPRDELGARAREIAERIAEVPAITAQLVKRSINDAQDLAGQRHAWRNHFVIHQLTSATETALGMAAEREKGSE